MNQNYDPKTVYQLINSYNAATVRLKATNSYQGLKHFTDEQRKMVLYFLKRFLIANVTSS